MQGAYFIALAAFCGAHVAVLAKLGPPGGPQKLAHGALDTFEAFASFPYSVAISDSDNDTMFEQYIPFHGKAGSTPGTMEVTVGDDPTVRDGVFYYYSKDCVVMDLEYHGHQCLLWTRWIYKDNVPQHCIDHFVDTCGVVPPAHSRDLCPDGEGDY
ncbi:hypothetical protein HPB50_014225 [Hyalomma asiaticum]|uniref:Uncharacterized protein n=1 Tax=Hyalomma asiaticum TaxID=266040 RepID=A0ACB7TDW6_HYAAI|nr:hypothetical protein HPB50_014225 [Hyalomma asiaticum]